MHHAESDLACNKLHKPRIFCDAEHPSGFLGSLSPLLGLLEQDSQGIGAQTFFLKCRDPYLDLSSVSRAQGWPNTACAPPLLCPPGTKEMAGTAPQRFWRTAESPHGVPPLLEARIIKGRNMISPGERLGNSGGTGRS